MAMRLRRCPNCGRETYSSRGDSRWSHDRMVCSHACGERLHAKHQAGMWSPDETAEEERTRLMRWEIKRLRHRLGKRTGKMPGNVR